MILLIFAASGVIGSADCGPKTTQITAEAKFLCRTFLVALVGVGIIREALNAAAGREPGGAYSGTRIFRFGSDFCLILALFEWVVATTVHIAPADHRRGNFFAPDLLCCTRGCRENRGHTELSLRTQTARSLFEYKHLLILEWFLVDFHGSGCSW